MSFFKGTDSLAEIGSQSETHLKRLDLRVQKITEKIELSAQFLVYIVKFLHNIRNLIYDRLMNTAFIYIAKIHDLTQSKLV